jgi:FecR protein
MKNLISLCCLLCFLAGGALWPAQAAADSGHARIVRLSLVQGDVRYSAQFHKDSLDDVKAVWKPAPLNLPLREGYALATDNDARAEVEFENGAMAFLSANTVIEFYDLSLDDGSLITRLILRQGSAIFYVHPGKGDFFSVTGGDFSVEANGRTRFRLDNYDDGSTVSVEMGQINVLRNKENNELLEKGQSYSININDGQNSVVGRAPEYDDFDKWVSGRVDGVVTATTYSNQYVDFGPYSAGFSDLYNYGGWYNVPGYGYGWQPYGVGMGWNPFGYGSWGFDPLLGWNFIGSAPWAWLPYHYGGWFYNPGLGWLWTPTGFGAGGPVAYRPVTAYWVNSGGVNGLVPVHPADAKGQTPLNLRQGVYLVHGNTIAATATPASAEKVSVANHPPRGVLTAEATSPMPGPVRVSRTILSGSTGSRAVTLSRDSSIVYDGKQHVFVNSSDPAKTPAEATKVVSAGEVGRQAAVPGSLGGTAKPPAPPSLARTAMARPNIAPPMPPASRAHGSSAPAAIWDDAPSPAARRTSSATGGTASHSSGHH